MVCSSEMGGYEDVEDLVGAEGGDGWRAKGIVAWGRLTGQRRERVGLFVGYKLGWFGWCWFGGCGRHPAHKHSCPLSPT